MTDNIYAELIAEAYEGELVGERLYRALSEFSDNDDQRLKLLTISAVEGRTHRQMTQTAARWAIQPLESDMRDTLERRIVQLRKLSWMEFINKAVSEWPGYTSRFEALHRAARGQDEPALRTLVEHERALVEFANLERANPGSHDSLAPLLAFLHSVPA